jgi:hypothetical protein
LGLRKSATAESTDGDNNENYGIIPQLQRFFKDKNILKLQIYIVLE